MRGPPPVSLRTAQDTRLALKKFFGCPALELSALSHTQSGRQPCPGQQILASHWLTTTGLAAQHARTGWLQHYLPERQTWTSLILEAAVLLDRDQRPHDRLANTCVLRSKLWNGALRQWEILKSDGRSRLCHPIRQGHTSCWENSASALLERWCDGSAPNQHQADARQDQGSGLSCLDNVVECCWNSDHAGDAVCDDVQDSFCCAQFWSEDVPGASVQHGQRR